MVLILHPMEGFLQFHRSILLLLPVLSFVMMIIHFGKYIGFGIIVFKGNQLLSKLIFCDFHTPANNLL
ncbi:hypothetical protein EP18_14275 [Lysinibacillus sphaericus]|nr:hypothetical protein EP18_14275 [Lysinibacillus sphaericus]